jgi:CHAD domain-containing protein
MIAPVPYLEELRTHVGVARDGRDPEGVHQVRAASRRLDAWLRLGGHHVLRDDLGWLRHELAAARDLDVLVGRELPSGLHSWLEDRRRDEQARVVRALDDERVEATLEALGRLPAIRADEAHDRVPRLIRRVLRRGQGAETDATDTTLHALRKSIRTLRFALDWLGERHELSHLQDAFGEHSDRVALSRWIAARGDAIGAPLDEEIHDKRAEVLKIWRDSQPELEALRSRWNST